MAWKASAAAPTSSRSRSPRISWESASRTVGSSSAINTRIRPFTRSSRGLVGDDPAALRGQPELDGGAVAGRAGGSPPSSGQFRPLPHGRQSEMTRHRARRPVQVEPLAVVLDPDEEAAPELLEQYVHPAGPGVLAHVVQGLLGDA